MANFEAFRQIKKLSSHLFFLKSDYIYMPKVTDIFNALHINDLIYIFHTHIHITYAGFGSFYTIVTLQHRMGWLFKTIFRSQ